MFARPRTKKGLGPPPKKRKASQAIEDISFDNDARADYLTGFHKRKLQRIKNAQEEAAKRARQEKIETRKQIKDERKREVEEHVHQVEALLREAQRAGGVSDRETSDGEEAEGWDSISDAPVVDPVDHEEEYVDEDKYMHITIESVAVSRDGLVKPAEEVSEDDEDAKKEASGVQQGSKDGTSHPKKKQKFRYETKAERDVSRRKQKVKKLRSRG